MSAAVRRAAFLARRRSAVGSPLAATAGMRFASTDSADAADSAAAATQRPYYITDEDDPRKHTAKHLGRIYMVTIVPIQLRNT